MSCFLWLMALPVPSTQYSVFSTRYWALLGRARLSVTMTPSRRNSLTRFVGMATKDVDRRTSPGGGGMGSQSVGQRSGRVVVWVCAGLLLVAGLLIGYRFLPRSHYHADPELLGELQQAPLADSEPQSAAV